MPMRYRPGVTIASTGVGRREKNAMALEENDLIEEPSTGGRPLHIVLTVRVSRIGASGYVFVKQRLDYESCQPTVPLSRLFQQCPNHANDASKTVALSHPRIPHFPPHPSCLRIVRLVSAGQNRVTPRTRARTSSAWAHLYSLKWILLKYLGKIRSFVS